MLPSHRDTETVPVAETGATRLQLPAATTTAGTVAVVHPDLLSTLASGRTVTWRPVGNSMRPLICSRQEVTVAPCLAERLEIGDVVLARVAGHLYLHRVHALDRERGRVQIANNRGRVNGWTPYARVYGILVAVEGRPRPRTTSKRADRPST